MPAPDARRSVVFFVDGSDDTIAVRIEEALDDYRHMELASVTPAAWDTTLTLDGLPDGGFYTRYMVVLRLREDT